MKAVASARRLLTVVVTAVCIVAGPSAAAALEAVPPAARPYVVRTFGSDPMGDAGPAVRMTADPSRPDSYYGWYRSFVQVTLRAERPAIVRYAWDDPGGRWRPYQTPLLAPEGKHVLYAQAEEDGRKGPLTALEVKVDHRSPRLSLLSSTAGRTGFAEGGNTSDAGVVQVTVRVNPHAGPRVVRIWGPDRYGTCQQIGKVDFPSGANTAIVARGDEFPDALSAAPLAGVYGAPIVLTRTSAMPGVTLNLLSDLGVSRVIIVGSERAVSGNVASQLSARGIIVERIGGVDRYETAALIASAVVERGGQRGQAFVARGDLFPDSLAVSPFAFRASRPILLVRPTSVPGVTQQALGDLAIGSVVIAGSERAVSAEVENEIRAAGVSTSRAQGPDRYGTAVAAARYGVASGLGDFHLVGLATGQNFPDALCGGAAIGSLGGVILMTPKDYLVDSVAAELRSHGPELRDIQVYGSEYAVSKRTWDQLLDTVR